MRIFGKRLASTAMAAAMALGIAGCCLVDPAPQANFTWSPSEPLAREQIQFTDLSTDTGGPLSGGGVTSWQWDFGDGGSSSVANPTHTYQQGGDYTVQLTVTDNCGNSDTASKTIHVGYSLEGRWTGDLWDAFNNRFQLELILHQSGGSITGTAYVTGLSSPIISGSFNPQTRQVRIQFAYAGTGNTWLLIGTYDPTLDCIEGYWENITLNPGVKVGDWRVCRM